MNAFLGKVKRTSEFVAMILFFVASFFALLYYIGNFGNDFMPVIGNLFSMLLEVGIWLIVPLLILLKKRRFAKWASLAVAAYWLISTLFSLFRDMAMARSGGTGLAISIGIFSFLAASSLVVAAVFAVLSVSREKPRMKIPALGAYGTLLTFYFVLFSLWTADYATMGAGWNEYFSLVYSYLIVPFAILFIGIAFGFKEEEFVLPRSAARAAKKQEKQADKAQEKENVVSMFVEDIDAERGETEEDIAESEDDADFIAEEEQTTPAEQDSAEE